MAVPYDDGERDEGMRRFREDLNNRGTVMGNYMRAHYYNRPNTTPWGGGKRKKRRRKTRKEINKIRMKDPKYCCVGPGCPDHKHCINIRGDKEYGIRPKSPKTLCKKLRKNKTKKRRKKRTRRKRGRNKRNLNSK